MSLEVRLSEADMSAWDKVEGELACGSGWKRLRT